MTPETENSNTIKEEDGKSGPKVYLDTTSYSVKATCCGASQTQPLSLSVHRHFMPLCLIQVFNHHASSITYSPTFTWAPMPLLHASHAQLGNCLQGDNLHLSVVLPILPTPLEPFIIPCRLLLRYCRLKILQTKLTLHCLVATVVWNLSQKN